MKVLIDQNPPLSPATLHILLALAGGELHGYGIIQEVARHSEGRYRIGSGTLYDNLKKLLDSGLVKETLKAKSADGEERRYYSLTADGQGVLASEIGRLERVVSEANLRLAARKPWQV